MASNQHASNSRPQWRITEDYLDSLKGPNPDDRTCRNNRRDDFLDALKHQNLLQDGLYGLKQALQRTSDQVNTNEIQCQLQNVSDGAARLHEFIVRNLGSDLLIGAPTRESAAKAQEVFDAAELAEMVLLLLSPQDLMGASLVNKAFAASISASSKLQIKLCRRADASASWTTMFDRERYLGIKCSIDNYERVPDGKPGEVKIKVSTETYSFVPRAYRKLLICQPPVYELLGMPDCCSSSSRRGYYNDDGRPQPPPLTRIVSETGITAEDVCSVSRELSRAHRNCPFALEYQHNRKGEVEVGALFWTNMILRPSDPAIPEWYHSDPEPYSPSGDAYAEQCERRENRPTEFERYYDAKKDALANGAPIPTFQQWREVNQADTRCAKTNDDSSAVYDDSSRDDALAYSEWGRDGVAGNKYWNEVNRGEYETETDWDAEDRGSERLESSNGWYRARGRSFSAHF